MIVLRKV